MPTVHDLAPRLQGALLLDWDAPELRGPLFVGPDGAARKRLTDLVSPRSDAAVTWNVFRTLERLPAAAWLPHVLGVPASGRAWQPVQLRWWPSVPPPRARLLWLLDHLDALRFYDQAQAAAADARVHRVAAALDRWRQQVQGGALRGDGVFETAFEADVAIDAPEACVLVSGLYRRDIERRTAWDPERDALARGLDAALELAGPAREPWLLLVTDDYRHEGPDVRAMAYEGLAPRYRDDPAFLAARLPHRLPAEQARMQGKLRWLSWADLLDIVLDNSTGLSPAQRLLLRRLVDYLKGKRLLFKGG